MVSVVIHTNPAQPHQVEFGDALEAGFRVYGHDAKSTPSIEAEADIHVVQGPWYAYKRWLGHEKTLYLDRCFWGDARHVVSLGWLRPDGSRDFRNQDMENQRYSCFVSLPQLAPQKDVARIWNGKTAGAAMVFGDYGANCSEMMAAAHKIHGGPIYYRPHPRSPREPHKALMPDWDLEAIWRVCDVAIGCKSTVLVDAKINGLHTVSLDENHVVNHPGTREEWLRDLSWAQWHLEEVRSGGFLDLLERREHWPAMRREFERLMKISGDEKIRALEGAA